MTKYETNVGVLLEEYDEFASNPRTNDDGLFTKFITFSRRHLSPDKSYWDSFYDWMKEVLGVRYANEIDALFENKDKNAIRTLIEKADKKGYILLPVYKYEHSGVVYEAAVENPFSCPFDSCLIGIIYCPKTSVYDIFGKRCSKNMLKKVHEMMEAEVCEYSKWADGECYIYCLEGANEWIGGFYGDIGENGALDEFGITEYSMMN